MLDWEYNQYARQDTTKGAERYEINSTSNSEIS